jgi:isonocardicin synthase
MEPKISPGSADVVFVRFLNSEVVTSAEAEQLLTALLPTVKTGNYMVIFGHTPVLLSSAHLSMIDNFIVKQCIGTADDKSGIFQYYVLQRVL